MNFHQNSEVKQKFNEARLKFPARSQDLAAYGIKKKELSKKAQKQQWDSGVKKPECLAADDGNEYREPMLSKDYHPDVFRQGFREWGANGAVIFTSGNGTPALAAALEKLPTLAFGIDESHANILQYSLEKAMARHIARHEGPVVTKINEIVASAMQQEEEARGSSPDTGRRKKKVPKKAQSSSESSSDSEGSKSKSGSSSE